MGLKEWYYYFFYKFYKLAALSPSTFPSDFVAVVLIIWLELFLLGSFAFYYKDFVDHNVKLKVLSIQGGAPLVLIIVINCLAFLDEAKWKPYEKKFDKLSEEENDKRTLIVMGVAVAIIANFVITASLS